MLKLLSSFVLLVSFGASASFVQRDCSNADQSVSISTGHVKSRILLDAQPIYGTSEVRSVLYDHQDLVIKVVSTKDVDQSFTSGCTSGPGGRISTSTKITLEEIEITKRDGSDFAREITGTERNKKVIKTHVVCKRYSSFAPMCPSI